MRQSSSGRRPSEADNRASPSIRFDGARPRAFRYELAAGALVVLGLLLRLQLARGLVLSSDERDNLWVAGSDGWLQTYRESLTSPHPPFFFLVLNVWKRIAGTEWELRLLSVLFATASLATSYLWVRKLLGKTGALTALALLSLLPPLLLLTAEIRGYALLLLLETGGLALLELALDRGSSRHLLGFAALEAVALLTHYSAVFLLGAAFVYSAWRLRRWSGAGRFLTAWVVSQAALAGLFAMLFALQLSHLHGSAEELKAKTDWLRASYYHSQTDRPLEFVGRQTLALSTYIFSSKASGIAALVLGLIGIVWLTARRSSVAILATVPFAAGIVAGLLDLYPYGGSRHCMVLAPFACLAVASALERIGGGRPWVALVLTAALLPGAVALVW